jgi:pimeloyl-ACP methyl ester carboxylesterase
LAAPELISAVVLYETGMAWVPGWDDTRLREVLWAEDPHEAAARLMLGDRFDALSPEQRARRLAQTRAFVAEERSVRTGAAPFEIAALEMPLVFGLERNAISNVVAKHLTDVVERVEVVEFDGAGHNAHLTQPEAFADLVRRGMAAARV